MYLCCSMALGPKRHKHQQQMYVACGMRNVAIYETSVRTRSKLENEMALQTGIVTN